MNITIVTLDTYVVKSTNILRSFTEYDAAMNYAVTVTDPDCRIYSRGIKPRLRFINSAVTAINDWKGQL